MIDKFEGKYEFLSNFYPSQIQDTVFSEKEIWYPTVEHAFQAAKTFSPTLRYSISMSSTPSEAKRKGHKVPLRKDWEDVKDAIMKKFLLQKFQHNSKLSKQLLQTGDEELIEGNTWHDNYWGNCTCNKCNGVEGQNRLGKLLMEVREQIKNNPCIDCLCSEVCRYKTYTRSGPCKHQKPFSLLKETIGKTAAKMPKNMITREMIKKGFERNIISIENEFGGCTDICCKIGDNAFYFVGTEDESLTVEEYWKTYTMDMTIEMLYGILKDVKSAEDSGLDEGEWEYYKALLKTIL